jgi:hypothetical protein
MNEITSEDEPRAKAVILEMRRLRPFQLRQFNSFDCLRRITKDTIEEHNAARGLLDIPQNAFFWVDKILEPALLDGFHEGRLGLKVENGRQLLIDSMYIRYHSAQRLANQGKSYHIFSV